MFCNDKSFALKYILNHCVNNILPFFKYTYLEYILHVLNSNFILTNV